jgi:hypothetical protein
VAIFLLVFLSFSSFLACDEPSNAERLEQNRRTWEKLDQKEKDRITENWLRLSKEERNERVQVLESLDRRTPEERERLRRLNARTRRLEDEVLRRFQPSFIARLNGRPMQERRAIMQYILGRWNELARERVYARLSDDELQSLRDLRGPDRLARIHDYREENEEQIRAANRIVIDEISRLDDETLMRKVRAHHERRIREELADLGVEDQALLDWIATQPPHRGVRYLRRGRESRRQGPATFERWLQGLRERMTN